ncbi:MAG TPA: NACHT domain-containing protein [Syntrophales bacterium]|nr:NACHT domain-containing protein [Syntrophales bacterium]
MSTKNKNIWKGQMITPTKLRLLASTNNERGDLFTRLTGDLFFALGYDDLQFDVHKSGREIDIQGIHRLEPRRLVAECKAHAEKIGGAELNKFFGVVTRERSKQKTTPVIGYFVSLNGFKETGIEQEQDTDEQTRNILLDGKRVIEELSRIRILIDHVNAIEQAGRCAAYQELKDIVVDSIELLGHELGYVWAIYYSKGKQRTHFALIHADGTPLASVVANVIVAADRKCKGPLQKLEYLAPPTTYKDQEVLAKETLSRYRQWVVTEFGDIQLDGLPADADLSTFRMKLERLFVPLKVIFNEDRTNNESTFLAGEFLSKHSRFSLLAKPGGGKSTLLKRIAVAYAEPSRLSESDDGLPDKDWIPLILRCRELRDRAHRPIRELLDDLPQHAAMSSEQISMFRSQIDEALQTGRVLLLVDGLDEISDQGARTTFAGHLRTFLAMFPQVGMVVTSREAGYRHVAGVIASICEQVTLSPFDEQAVQKLCENWHVEVVGDSEAIRAEARELSDTIWQNERIRVLAENPLMLTTLLVVRRCIGELPTRRVSLYREAVRVLIYTWNTEGFAPMDLDETLAQLSYVACVMMNEGVQQIGRKRLLNLLQDARDEMQEELQFTRISPAEFIERIEYRSSLLMQTGHEKVDEELQPVYEFRHLTFQEYLAARGLVEEQYPGRNNGQSLVDLLAPHFEEERWREVIPLAAVIAGRKAEPLIKRLTSVVPSHENSITSEDYDTKISAVVPLRQCLLDEVLITPSSLKDAILVAARYTRPGKSANKAEFLSEIYYSSQLRGKFAKVFEETVSEAYFGMNSEWDYYLQAMVQIAGKVFQNPLNQFDAGVEKKLNECLKSGDRIKQALSAFHLMDISFTHTAHNYKKTTLLGQQAIPLRDAIGNLLSLEDPPLVLAASWALVWLGINRLTKIPEPPKPEVIQALFKLWCETDSATWLHRFAGWALSTQPLLQRDTFPPEIWGDCDYLFTQKNNENNASYISDALLVLAWYRRSPWDDSELVKKMRQVSKYNRDNPTIYEMLATLGTDGQRVLDEWKAEEKNESSHNE